MSKFTEYLESKKSINEGNQNNLDLNDIFDREIESLQVKIDSFIKKN